MSSQQRRKELAAIREAEDRAREEEAFRKANLSLWERVNELAVDDEMKAVLLLIAERAGVECWE